MATKGAHTMHDLAVALCADEWVTDAACSPDVAEFFWPLPGQNGPTVEAALKLCSRCPVVRECGQWALDNRQTEGIWGGMRPGALRRLVESRRAKEIAADPPPPVAWKPPPTRCGRGHELRGPGLWPCPTCSNSAKKRQRMREASTAAVVSQ